MLNKLFNLFCRDRAMEPPAIGPQMIFEGFPQRPPIRREAAKIGRNGPCSCGSGKKFKKCCGKI